MADITFEEQLAGLQRDRKDWNVLSSGEYDHSGPNEIDYTHFESAFCADALNQCPGDTILDIGSYLHFTLGLAARFKRVYSVDCRPYKGVKSENIENMVCDARSLPFPDEHFPLIVSQCTLEHIGLGVYGDEIDFDADGQAMEEVKRVLRPGGFFVFTTTLADTERPVVMFNMHRIYTYKKLQEYLEGMAMQWESLYSFTEQKCLKMEELTTAEGGFDVYGGCWQKSVLRQETE